jgi:hypothetical protein
MWSYFPEYPHDSHNNSYITVLMNLLRIYLRKFFENTSSCLLSSLIKTRNPNKRGRICTVDLLVLTTSDQLFLILKQCISFYKRIDLNEEVIRTEPSLSVRFP